VVDLFTATALDMYFSLSWSLIAVVLCSAPTSTVPLLRMDEEFGAPAVGRPDCVRESGPFSTLTTAPVVPTSFH
jgi:hypothetical protein